MSEDRQTLEQYLEGLKDELKELSKDVNTQLSPEEMAGVEMLTNNLVRDINRRKKGSLFKFAAVTAVMISSLEAITHSEDEVMQIGGSDAANADSH